MARPFPLLRLLVLGVGLSFQSLALSRAAEEEKLVPARFNPQMDSRGNRWDIDQLGAVADGSNDCFDRGALLRVQGSDVSFSRPIMTADGSEFVLSGRRGTLAITRRVRLDAANAMLRYVDVFENTGGSPQSVSVTVHTDLGGNAMQVVDSKNKLFLGLLPKDEGAFVAIHSGGNRPGVVFLVADPASKNKPTVQMRDLRSFDVTYPLELKPQSSVAIVHYLAQRLNATSDDAKTLLAAVYKRGRLTDRSLPPALAGALANWSTGPSEGSAEGSASGSVLGAFSELVEAAGLSRDKLDALLIDPGSKLAGTVTGSDFEMETEWGKTPVAFAEVAGVAGGAGVQKPIRVFLRGGEILSGTVQGASFAMATDTGLSFPIELAQIHLLAMRKVEGEGAAPAGTAALVGTHRGERLALAPEPAAGLEAATPWGMVRVPIEEVEALSYRREPFPAHQLALADGSRFLVMLRGAEWSVGTVRFGPVKLVPQTVRELRRVGSGGRVLLGADGEGDPPGPHCALVGENRLAGTIDLPAIHLASESSVTPLNPKQIVEIKCETGDEPAIKGLLTVKLADGQELRGRLRESVLPIRAGERVWRVPVAHLVSIHAPPPHLDAPPAEPPAPAPSTAPTTNPQ